MRRLLGQAPVRIAARCPLDFRDRRHTVQAAGARCPRSLSEKRSQARLSHFSTQQMVERNEIVESEPIVRVTPSMHDR